MAKIEIYTTRACPYCTMAKSLLERKQADYEEIAVDDDSDKMAEAVLRSGGRKTVPQIFIDDKHVGGYDELNALEKKGLLDSMIAGDN
ncbi:MAG: glutaredoxin 3 [Desulfobacteraceae bacterium]|nr:glutaredoxin 3 [Desulfobacteraceae bacterium]